MINQENRLCYDCTHLLVLSEGEDYSENTPGFDASIRCGWDHWWVLLGTYDEPDPDVARVRLRDGLRMARTCPDFEPV